MAGHSKWANIQHRKSKVDAKRGKMYTKLVREIGVAARMGGGDLEGNPRLRLAVDKATAASMPKDNIERAIKKATGELEGVEYEEIRYEGYGPHGVAIMIDCLTDNRNRTVAEVRHIFSRFGGNMGTEGSVAYMFRRIGVLSFAPGTDEDKVTEVAIESGAEDVTSFDDGALEVITSPEDFEAVRNAMREAGLDPDDSEVTERADTEVALTGDDARSVANLLDALDDMDDTQNTYSNADLPPEAYE